MKIEKAVYRPAILPEHRGNPLIEALPTKYTDEELVDRLSFYPLHSFDETQLSPFERVEYLTRLRIYGNHYPSILTVLERWKWQ